MKLHIPIDCGNSPRRQLIKDLYITFAENDLETFYSCLVDDITWNFVGGSLLSGKQEIKEFFEKNKLIEAEEFLVDYILTHGNLCSVGGKITLPDKNVHFANFYEFTSVNSKKIKRIKSFVLIEPRNQG